MKKYKLSTVLWDVNETPEFETDSEAWEYLRKKLPNKYATLYRNETFLVPYNNAAEYVNKYNAKYGPKPIGFPESAKLLNVDDLDETEVWIPVLHGLTNDEYNVKKQ